VEKIIYALIPIAYFIFQAYNNYKKEQEKAKKRNLSQPYSVVQPEAAKPEVIQNKQQFDVKEFLKEKFNLETERKEVIKTQTRSIPEYQTKDYYNPEVPSEEVVQNRKVHAPHQHKAVLPILEELENPFVFNLKEAIIQQAILNRPYKD